MPRYIFRESFDPPEGSKVSWNTSSGIINTPYSKSDVEQLINFFQSTECIKKIRKKGRFAGDISTW